MFSQDPAKVLIVVDYDDTVLPSTRLNKLMTKLHLKSPFELPRHIWCDQAWKQYEKYASEALKHLKTLGRVCIVTNAEENWVQWSCQAFFPQVWLELQDLEIISARSSFEFASTSSAQWKVKAFENLCEQYSPSQVLSLGDSHMERMAARKVFPENCKTIKFTETPSLSELHRQWKFMVLNYSVVVKYPGVLDLQLTVTPVPKPDFTPLSEPVRCH
jgi:FMN phosphatase YigB (HAD superfamily)